MRKVKPYRLASVDTLVKLAKAGKDGRYWYRFANAQVKAGATILGVSPTRFADILALTSPQCTVIRNVRRAIQYCRKQTLPADVPKSIRASVKHWEATGVIRGPKTGPFAKALLGDEYAIVLDTWMAKVFGINAKRLEVRTIHSKCCDRIWEACHQLRKSDPSWTPAQVQAAVWTAAVTRAGRRAGELYIEAELDGVPF